MVMLSKFQLTLEGVDYDGARRQDLIILNGVEYQYEINEKQILIGGTQHSVTLSGSSAEVDGIAYEIKTEGLEDAKRATRTRKAASAAAGAEAGAVTALMPGLIIKVLKNEGDKVEAGEVVIILEAMKMQNELTAPISGTLRQVNVKQGENVEIRQVLCVIE
jgi:biotin carboxyl carrier protein